MEWTEGEYKKLFGQMVCKLWYAPQGLAPWGSQTFFEYQARRQAEWIEFLEVFGIHQNNHTWGDIEVAEILFLRDIATYNRPNYFFFAAQNEESVFVTDPIHGPQYSTFKEWNLVSEPVWFPSQFEFLRYGTRKCEQKKAHWTTTNIIEISKDTAERILVLGLL